jgi:ABC-2 type transport system ATP-binding protein
MAIVEVKNVTFTYRVLRNKSTSIKELFRDFLHGHVRITNYVALKDVSFTVDKGEVFAILGRNGTAVVTGAIAPMIELGAGFHPEMTGAENVLFYSALMGRDVKQVKTRINAIGEWAGVTDHMDFPLRAFSSGMVARLAFSTATDVQPEVLLIDEILSVGDAEFKEKSATRLKSLLTGGAAAILVSHDMAAIRELAQRAIWLDKGEVKMVGLASDVVDAYEAALE